MAVKLGVGVIIERDGKILIGKRISEYAPYYSIPGGTMEEGESFEDAAIREIKEECGITLINPEVVCISNNLQTYEESGIHFVSIILYCNTFEGEPQQYEPDKCEGWDWYDPKEIPQPHFEASELGIKEFYDIPK